MARKRTPTEDATDDEPAFEQLLQRLDAIVQELETGQLGLTESLTRFEQGIGHLKQCYRALDQAEQRVALITGTRPNGEPILQPMDDDADSLEDKARKRSERRSHP
jgi:exodeoxyribonuclease VII small subunit